MKTSELGTVAGETVDMKLEVVVVPVSDVDRAKHFYEKLGWRLDADIAAGDSFRVVQFTPPGSQCSIFIGKGLTPAGFASRSVSHCFRYSRPRAPSLSAAVSR